MKEFELVDANSFLVRHPEIIEELFDVFEKYFNNGTLKKIECIMSDGEVSGRFYSQIEDCKNSGASASPDHEGEG